MRSLDLAVLQYREGITDFTTVLTAQQSLLSEQDSLASTLGDISRNLVGAAGPGGRLGDSGRSTASWELDFWGKFRRAIQSADASLQATIADYDNVLVSLTADVASNYILMRTLEKRLAIANENVRIQTESLQIAQARFSGGTTSERDVEQAKTILANTQATIPTLESQLRQTKNALSVLLGLPPQDLANLFKGKAVIPAPPPQVAVGIPADLIRRRPDIRAAEFRAAAQCDQIGVSKAQLFPAFSLTGTFGPQATDVGTAALSDMFNWRNRAGSMGPTVQWNILNYGQITNNVRFQDAQFQELLITYQNSVLKAQQEVEDNLVAFLKAQERARFLSDSTTAAMRSLELAVIQYREGITDFTTVLTAQQALLSEQDSLAVHPGRHLPESGGGLPGPGGRLGDSGRSGFCAGGDQRNHGQTHQLGPPAGPGGGGGGAGPGGSRPPDPRPGLVRGRDRGFCPGSQVALGNPRVFLVPKLPLGNPIAGKAPALRENHLFIAPGGPSRSLGTRKIKSVGRVSRAILGA